MNNEYLPLLKRQSTQLNKGLHANAHNLFKKIAQEMIKSAIRVPNNWLQLISSVYQQQEYPDNEKIPSLLNQNFEDLGNALQGVSFDAGEAKNMDKIRQDMGLVYTSHQLIQVQIAQLESPMNLKQWYKTITDIEDFLKKYNQFLPAEFQQKEQQSKPGFRCCTII